MVLEVRDSDIHWLQPRDVTLEDLLSRGIDSNHPLEVHVIFADNTTASFRKTIDRATLKALLTRSGGEQVDPNSW